MHKHGRKYLLSLSVRRLPALTLAAAFIPAYSSVTFPVHTLKAVAPIISVCLLLLMQLCAHQSVRSILFVVNSFLRLTTMPFTASRSKNLCAHLQTGCASTTHQTSTRGTCAMSEQQLA